MFAVPAGKGKLEKISIRISLSYIAPATVAQRRYLRYLLVSAISHQWRTSPFAISVENRFSIIPFYRCLIKDFYRAKFFISCS